MENTEHDAFVAQMESDEDAALAELEMDAELKEFIRLTGSR